MKTKLTIVILVLLISTLKIFAQTDSTHNEKPLEVKFEFYPLPVFPSFNNKTIKIEGIVNYHNYLTTKGIYGIHFYYDGNTHWKEHNMEDLLTYSEVFAGFKDFQFGLEIGSLSGREYVAFGPQTTIYNFIHTKDGPVFERFSIVTRTYSMHDSLEKKENHFVFGYEYATAGLPLWNSKKYNFELASTGMGRILIPNHQRVLQASAWLKFVPRNIKKGHPIVSIGLEWENNTALIKFKNELYFGIEIDL